MKVLYIHKKCVQLYSLQNGKCFYCQGKREYHNLTRDHVNPIFKGGKAKYNVVLACGKCNSEKGHKTFYEFREFACKVLAEYLRKVHAKGIALNPKSGEYNNKIQRYKDIINRCTKLIKYPQILDDTITNYYKVDYKNALNELIKSNKLVPYLMTKTSDIFG